jgi:cell wall-associated NlpC family hydrolase
MRLKGWKCLKSLKWSLLLVPVISPLLLVTIITAAPSTISTNTYPKTIMASMGDLYPKALEIVLPVEVKNTLEPAAATTVAVNLNTPPPKAAPIKSRTTQPSRSSRSTPTTSSTLTPSTSKASGIIATAKQYIGVNYVFGGTTPSGFDCSGYTQYVFAKNGINLPRVSRDQFQLGTSVSFSNLQAGDLVFFSFAKNGVVDHVGIYVGNGQFINAASSKGVTIYTLGSYWENVFVGAKHVL